MSTCIVNADEYKDKMVQVVQTKKAIVVGVFFTYIVYVVCTAIKHCLASSSDEKKRMWSEKLGLVQHDIACKSFFFFYLILLCS